MDIKKTAVLCLLIFSACSRIPDVISKFQDGINNKDAVKVSQTISKSATQYTSLANNNWSGLAAQIVVWSAGGTYQFSGLTESITGDDATVSGTAVMSVVGSRPCSFQMVNEEEFLFFKAWKIKQWTLVRNGTNILYLQRAQP